MWSAAQPRVLLQLAALYAMGLPIAALSHAALSLFPPGGLYNRPLSPSNVLVTERHAWDAPLKAPKWIGMSGTHLPQVQPTDATPHPQEPPYPTLHSRQVPPSRDALLVVDVRCLTEPRLATSAKSQGWAVMPLFLGGAVASGVYRLPMYAGPPTKDALQQIAAECSAEAKGWAGGVELLLKRKLLKLVEGASVTVFLLDAQRFGEWEEEEVTCRQQGGRSRTSAALASLLVSLPPPHPPPSGSLSSLRPLAAYPSTLQYRPPVDDSFLKDARGKRTAAKPERTPKLLSSLLSEGAAQADFEAAANRAMAEAFGIPGRRFK